MKSYYAFKNKFRMVFKNQNQKILPKEFYTPFHVTTYRLTRPHTTLTTYRNKYHNAPKLITFITNLILLLFTVVCYYCDQFRRCNRTEHSIGLIYLLLRVLVF